MLGEILSSDFGGMFASKEREREREGGDGVGGVKLNARDCPGDRLDEIEGYVSKRWVGRGMKIEGMVVWRGGIIVYSKNSIELVVRSERGEEGIGEDYNLNDLIPCPSPSTTGFVPRGLDFRVVEVVE